MSNVLAIVQELERQVEQHVLSLFADGQSHQDEESRVACHALACLRSWSMSGRVMVTTDATTQALLACTPIGLCDPDDFESPYSGHLTVFDPPIPLSGTPGIRWLISGSVPINDVPGIAVTWGIEPDYGLGYGSFWSAHSDVADRMKSSTLDPASSALRVAIGLSRLIKSAPPGTRKTTGPAPVEIVDRGISKKKGTRSILVRRLFVVEQSIAEACRAALRGGPRAPCLRHLVRGHWRNQACGPAHKERNLMWIQPHWRGTMKDFLRPVEVRVS